MSRTVTAFYGALNSLVITGVSRQFAYEPNQVTTADLPAQWVRLPTSGAGFDGAFATACVDTSKERTAQLVVVVEAGGQETPGAATTALLTIIDNMETALDTLSATVPFLDYSMEAGKVDIGQTSYWAVVATVTERG